MASGAAAALLLLAVFSALDRAETARSERVDWRAVSSLSASRGYDAAAAYLDARLAAHPGDALLHYYRARLYYEADLGAEALAEADKAIALGYAQEISHLLKALVYGRLYGDRARQFELASKALAYDPTYDDGYLVRAEAGYALRKYGPCAADAAAYTSLQPAETDGLELSLLCLEAQGDSAGAERAGRAILKLKPDSHSALWRLGRIYAGRGLHRRAVKNFSEAIRLSGGRPRYYLDRAASCAELGDHSCAAWDYASATDWREISGYASYYYLLGAAMYRAGELDQALGAAGTAVEKAPADAGNYELRGRLRAETGDLAGARRDFLAALALEPAREPELRPLLAGGPAKDAP
ncbi:MAG: hypothetical protein PHV33_01500 [Elusimicrobiales bacterium]|nr:hypothetical protein [Elusimicrobiales bacterium]